MEADRNVAVITAGTPGVTGFDAVRRREAGRQFIDVGIAEQEGVALASGMAKAGARPVFGVVSSFIPGGQPSLCWLGLSLWASSRYPFFDTGQQMPPSRVTLSAERAMTWRMLTA